MTVDCVWKKPSISELKKADAPSVAFCKDMLNKFHDEALVAKQNYEAACNGDHVTISHMLGCWLRAGDLKKGEDNSHYFYDINKIYREDLALINQEKMHFDKGCNLYPDDGGNWRGEVHDDLINLQNMTSYYQEHTPRTAPGRAVAQDSRNFKVIQGGKSVIVPPKTDEHSAK